tara:strand:+ start:664 stop:1398 length:735 start_codon:yes stop_codon:yes gene_type:complete
MKFSIITVVKNRVNEINKTIKSVLSQDFKNFEYIIIDGKSTDGTSEEILKFKNKILYFRESDKGLYHALNKAYIRCKGQIICHMHAGDIFAKKNILSKVNKKFENKNIDLLSGNLKFINLKTNKISRVWRYPIKSLNKYNVYKVPHTSIFFKKEILKISKNYNQKYKIASDTDFLLRLSNINLNYYYYDKFIIFMSNKGLSTSFITILKKIREDIVIYTNYFGFLGVLLLTKKIIYKVPSFFKS